MKKIVVAYFLFSLILLTLFWSVHYLNKTTTSLQIQSNELENLILKDSWDKAYSSSVDIFKKWEKASDNLSIVIDHQKLDNINIEVLKLTQYTKCNSKDEALASIHAIKFLFEHLINLEKISLQNIL